MIKKGDVDFLLGFEQLEAARWAPYLRPGGVAVVSDVVIIPVSVIGSTTPYPSRDEIEGILAQYAEATYFFPGTTIGLEPEGTKYGDARFFVRVP